MKTSNLLLIIAFGAIILGAIFGINGLKKHLIKTSSTPGVRFEVAHNLSEFEQISIQGGLSVDFKLDAVPSLTITADSATHDAIVIENSDGVLAIKLNNHRGPRIKCQLTGSLPNTIKTSAGAKFQTGDTLNGSNLKLRCSSGSSIDFHGNLSNIEAQVSSGSNIHVTGQGDTVTIQASSGSSAKFKDFEAKIATVTASSGSTVYVNAESVDATSSSGSSIYYNEGTVFKTVNTSSGAKVKKY